jgi:hypothetical protein
VAAVIVVAVIVLLLVAGAVYDRRMRRRGLVVRSSVDVLNEAAHHRVDMNAVPYEPARHAGQRDWATYRRRDRKRGNPA